MREPRRPARAGSGRSPGSRLAAGLVAGGVRAYQLTLSPLLGPACRFQPSCSQYALEAVERHGVVRGVWLGLRRIGRCHPFGGMGYDPVPEVERRGP